MSFNRLFFLGFIPMSFWISGAMNSGLLGGIFLALGGLSWVIIASIASNEGEK
jgi:hypothetical protein